jgi:hypothetical protein
MSRQNSIIVTIENGLEYTIVSAFLPQVGQRLILDGMNQQVEVLEVSFTGKSFLQSFSGLEGGQGLGEQLSEDDWLTPHLLVKIVSD